MNVLVLIVRYIIQIKNCGLIKTFDIIPVRLTALKISERWCDYGMDKRSISQPRQARDKQLLNLVNDNSRPIRLNALRSFLNF